MERGEVLQFLYGEDGMDAVALENQKLPHVGLHKDKLKKLFEHNVNDPHYGKENDRVNGRPWLRPGLAEEIKRSSDIKEALRQEYEEIKSDREKLTHPREGPFPKGKADPPVAVHSLLKNETRSCHTQLDSTLL